ncbi:MAG: N-acetylneuraminate synthase family protein [Elusimicrobia bacterium]|nr:N-acetylneuraminate synthase family protein [Elusimicrobiota bacterium]
MGLAQRLIDTARDAGADYVKFQYYAAQDCSDDDPEKEWFGRVQLDRVKLERLMGHCRKRGIEFLCTAWDEDKARDLFDLGCRDLKLASFHIANHALLRLANARARRIFLSTGMSAVADIDAAVRLVDRAELYLLHCVSEYPLPEERVSLKTMDWLRRRYGCKVGYSDHTLGLLAPLAAVARGADVVEKHITMSKTAPGTDHILSADPAELHMLVAFARRLTSMLGEETKIMTEGERKNQLFLRQRFSHGRKAA